MTTFTLLFAIMKVLTPCCNKERQTCKQQLIGVLDRSCLTTSICAFLIYPEMIMNFVSSTVCFESIESNDEDQVDLSGV